MLIDPFIVLAEIFNFLILVAVLQKFLYKPVMKTMANREQSIADRLRAAEEREAEAQSTLERYQNLQTEWAKQTQSRRHQMHQQIEAERTDQLEQVRAELERQRTQWSEALRQEQKACLVNLRDRARSQLIQTVRAALETLANASLEKQMVEVFITHIGNLSADDVASLQAAVSRQNNAPQWTVRTAFPLDRQLQQQLIDSVQAQLAISTSADAFAFETYSDYPCGIELRTEGYKIAWHFEHYLNSMESRLAYDLEEVSVL